MELKDLLASLVLDIPAVSSQKFAGARNLLRMSHAVRELATAGALGQIARCHLGPAAFPVRAILFDKSAATNWVVPFHQDITIPVQNRHETPGYGPWSVKNGIQHVQPPSAVLDEMLTLRLHLDDVDESSGPLLVFPASHAEGILEEARILTLQRTARPSACLARRGDLLLMHRLLVHGSHKATRPRQRRILHVEYAAADLPKGLEWAPS
jgi:ectoine hydroxylase-related dioxygenase (phytanoyl-CoA dioxygenase family)